MKLTQLVKEDWYTDKKRVESLTKAEPEIPQLSREDKIKFTEMVKRYNEYGGKIYNEHNLVEIAKDLSKISEMAEAIAMSSIDESFDKITVQRNMKELKQMSGQFAKVATEAQSLKQRMTGLYEDMGNILGRYFDIQEGVMTIKGQVTDDDKIKTVDAINKTADGKADPNNTDFQKYLDAKGKVANKLK